MVPQANITRRAFSLIEVLVALAIFALTVGVMAQALFNAMHGLEVVKSNNHEDQLYRFALRQVLRLDDRDEVEDGGSFQTPEDGPVDWEAEVEDTEVLDLFKLTVEMTLAESGGSVFDREAGRVESLYVYRPNWSDSVDRDSLKQDKQDALSNERLSPR